MDDAALRYSRLNLFSLGAATLFLELALIRYLAGNIWNLGYFPNLVLVAVFIGMGVGFVGHEVLDERRSRFVFVAAAAALLVLVLLVAVAHPALPGFGPWQGIVGGELYFSAQTEGESSPLLFIVWAGMIVAVFAGIAQRTAKAFRCFEPLHAYTLDIAGALTGIVAFTVCSATGLPPAAWFAIAALLLAIGAGGAVLARALAAVLVLATGGVAAWHDTHLLASSTYQGPVDVRWSPYQKLEVLKAVEHPIIFANGLVHQVVFDEPTLHAKLYFAPYEARAQERPNHPYQRVLILGAGSGNDVATALAAGAESVDAVDIDPRIPAIGKEIHPLHPYDDPRVHLTIDDGRAFMNRSDAKYDLIVFALTDSVVKVSAMSQLRLENYLFTRESVARAMSLLAPDGSLVLCNFYRQPWLIDKIAGMLREGSGREPAILVSNKDFVVFRVDADGAAATESARVDVASDDWPFLYLEARGVPPLYAGMLAAMAFVVLALLFGMRRIARETSPLLVRMAFLTMGAAFLLLETKSVVQFSLLFGTTWKNAAIVFAGVLVLVLAANRAVPLLPSTRNTLWVVFALLLLSCLAGFAVPLAALGEIASTPLRVVAAVLVTFLPLFFANLLFGVAFAKTKAPEHVFGWNLIGATLGGALEYSCMATGYRALGLLVALLYTIAFLLLASSRRAQR